MASFCVKCGAPLEPGAETCSACGATVARDAVPPPQSYAPVPPPPPAYGQMAGYGGLPPKRSGGPLKIVLIVVAVVIGLGVLALGVFGFAAWRIARGLHGNGSSITMGDKADVSESELGVGIYPGAVRQESGGMRIKTAANLVVSATYTTTDPMSAVVDFYRGKLGGAATETQAGHATVLTSTTVVDQVKDNMVVTLTPETQVDKGTTLITILHTRVTKH